MAGSILIVEDEIVISRMYQKLLTNEGYQVETAADGQEGWEKAKNHKPSLIMLDFMMPKLNGLQVLEKLKADPETASIPIIMLTNLAASEETDLAAQKGVSKYLIKSEVEPRQVINTVAEFLPKSTT